MLRLHVIVEVVDDDNPSHTYFGYYTPAIILDEEWRGLFSGDALRVHARADELRDLLIEAIKRAEFKED